MNLMWPRIGLLVVGLMIPAPVMADEREKEIADALTVAQEQKAVTQTWEGKNTDQPYIVLLNEYETHLQEDWSFEETYHTRIRIQREAAKELGEWPIYYNKAREEVTELKAFVETPDGKKFQASNIQDLQAFEASPMYSDMKVKMITFPQVNVGSVLDVTVKSKTTRKEIPGQFYDEIRYPIVPTKFARHTYILPAGKNIEFKAFKQTYKPFVEKKENQVKYSFVFEETRSPPDEELMPPLDDVLGGLYLSSINDWDQVGDWYRELVKKNIVADAEITAKTEELIKGKPTPTDKARAILEFMQDNFRYVALNFGDHTVEPHPTDEIYRNRYGDCKDLSLLAKQMFKIAGIDSNICLITNEFKGNPQNSLPNPTLFEHVMLEVFLDRTYFVDPQTKGFDFGQYPSSYDNAYAFVIEEAGSRFDRLPIAGEEDRTLINQTEVTLATDGSAVFEVKINMPLEVSQTFRTQWAATTNEDRAKFFESLEANYSQGGTMLSHEVKGVENRYGPIEFKFKYQSPNAYPAVNDMILLKEAEQSDLPDFAAKDRTNPIFLPINSLIRHRNIYHVPDDYKVDFIPANYKLSFDFVDISAEYTSKSGMVTVDTVYRLKRATVPAKRYAEVKKFRNEVYKKNDQYIVLKKKSQVASQAKDWLNTP